MIKTIRRLQEKINNYTPKIEAPHEPFKVEITVKPPIFTGNPWIHFDSLIQYLCTREALGEDFYNLPTNHLFNFQKMTLPLKRTGDVYHASVGIYDNPKLKSSKIYKRFEEYFIHHHPKLLGRKYNIGSGYYRNHMIILPFVITDKVTFYGCGIIREIERLIGHLTHLGKKTSIGGGKILKRKVREVEVDHSFYHDEYGVMRPIPHQLGNRALLREGQTIMRTAYKPPYWDKRNVELCFVPKNQLVESTDII